MGSTTLSVEGVIYGGTSHGPWDEVSSVAIGNGLRLGLIYHGISLGLPGRHCQSAQSVWHPLGILRLLPSPRLVDFYRSDYLRQGPAKSSSGINVALQYARAKSQRDFERHQSEWQCFACSGGCQEGPRRCHSPFICRSSTCTWHAAWLYLGPLGSASAER